MASPRRRRLQRRQIEAAHLVNRSHQLAKGEGLTTLGVLFS